MSMNIEQRSNYKWATRIQNLKVACHFREQMVYYGTLETFEHVAIKFSKPRLLIVYGRYLATPMKHVHKLENLSKTLIQMLDDIEAPLKGTY